MSNTLKDLRFKVWIAFLTFLSGFINVGAIRSFSLPVSHHTGNVSHLALSIANKNITEVFIIGSAILAFAGAFISGLLFHQRKSGLKKRYGILLMGLAMIFLSLTLFKTPQILKVSALSFAAGVQNAMFIFYGDILVRTTHITGYLTDAAFALAMCLRGKKDKFRFFCFTASTFFFLAGGIIAGLIKISSFFIASACLYLIAGLYYFMMRKNSKIENKFQPLTYAFLYI